MRRALALAAILVAYLALDSVRALRAFHDPWQEVANG